MVANGTNEWAFKVAMSYERPAGVADSDRAATWETLNTCLTNHENALKALQQYPHGLDGTWPLSRTVAARFKHDERIAELVTEQQRRATEAGDDCPDTCDRDGDPD